MKKFIYIVIGLLLNSCAIDIDLLDEILLTPSKVNLIFPENNSECTAGTVISETESEVLFEWESAEIGDGYVLLLRDLITAQETTFQTENNNLLIRLQRGNPYRWKVTTVLNDSEEVTESDFESFYNAGPGNQTFIPFPAINISPSNREQFPASTELVTLQWLANDLDNDITSYDIYFGTNNPPELFLENYGGTSLGDIEVTPANVYFWKIVTIDQSGNKSNSEIFTFEILN